MRNAAIGCAMMLISMACGGAPSSPPPAATSDPAETSTLFTVPEAQLSHLQIAPARRLSWMTTLHATGTVDWDGDHTTQAITQVSGPITRLLVDMGAHVKAGDPLLSVSSPDVSNAISVYRKAKNRLDLAQRNLDRNRDLLAHKAIAQRDLDAVEADFHDASTDVQAALQALKIYGVTAADLAEAEHQDVGIQPELAMRAPIAGTVVQKLVSQGQVIQAGVTAAFVISDVSTVWVQGHVYDRDLASVHVGDKVDVQNSALPQVAHGVVRYIGDLIDPATRTTPVRIVTENPRGQLKKDLFVDLVIHDVTRRDVLVVATSAVLYDEENLPFVYVQASPGKFARRLVKLGGQQGADTQIVDGITEGELVVTQGSLFIQFATHDHR